MKMKPMLKIKELELRLEVVTKHRDHLKEQLNNAIEKLIELQRILDARRHQAT